MSVRVYRERLIQFQLRNRKGSAMTLAEVRRLANEYDGGVTVSLLKRVGESDTPRNDAMREEIVSLLAAADDSINVHYGSITDNIKALVLSFAPSKYTRIDVEEVEIEKGKKAPKGNEHTLALAKPVHQAAFNKAKKHLIKYGDFCSKDGRALSSKWAMRMSRHAKRYGLDNGKQRGDNTKLPSKAIMETAVRITSEKVSDKTRKQCVEKVEKATVDTLTIPALTAIFNSRPEIVEELYRRCASVLNTPKK